MPFVKMITTGTMTNEPQERGETCRLMWTETFFVHPE